MKRVLKWTVPVDDNDHPVGSGPVVLVDCITPAYVSIWTEEDVALAGEKPEMRRARVYGTGQPVHDEEAHLGSTRHAASGLVWHVFGRAL